MMKGLILMLAGSVLLAFPGYTDASLATIGMVDDLRRDGRLIDDVQSLAHWSFVSQRNLLEKEPGRAPTGRLTAGSPLPGPEGRGWLLGGPGNLDPGQSSSHRFGSAFDMTIGEMRRPSLEARNQSRRQVSGRPLPGYGLRRERYLDDLEEDFRQRDEDWLRFTDRALNLHFRHGSRFRRSGYDVSIQDASVEVSAVPIPGAIWLLGSGLIGMAALRRKSVGAICSK